LSELSAIKEFTEVTARDGKELIARWLADGTFDERLPEVAALRGVPQPEEYHAEGDAFTHTMLAIEAVDYDADWRVFWGTLLHDVGKAEKTALVHGRWRSYGHGEAGAAMVPEIMGRLGLADISADVTWLVKNHLFHFSWNLHPGARLTGNQHKFMEHPLFPLLLRVCAADAAGSLGKSDKGEKIRMIAELFAEMTGG
jgi:hypothetical protein